MGLGVFFLTSCMHSITELSTDHCSNCCPWLLELKNPEYLQKWAPRRSRDMEKFYKLPTKTWVELGVFFHPDKINGVLTAPQFELMISGAHFAVFNLFVAIRTPIDFLGFQVSTFFPEHVLSVHRLASSGEWRCGMETRGLQQNFLGTFFVGKSTIK